MPTLDHAWDSLVTMTLQGAMLCLLAAAGVLLLRKAAAASRHLVLLLSVSALLAAPLLALFLPHWQVSLNIGGAKRARYAAEQAAFQAREQVRLRRPDARPQRSETPAPASPAREATLPSPSQDMASAHRGQIPFSAAVASVEDSRTARIPARQAADGKRVLLSVWMLGAVVFLLRLPAGLVGAWILTARETVADPVLSRVVMQMQAELGMKRTITVRQTRAGSTLPVPLTWGLFRPMLLLPATFLDWPPERQRMVVRHELAHIQRADWLVQMLIQMTRALYWFHPLVWWTTLRLQAESERACDDMVLLTGVAPSAYAETLLEVVRTMNRPKKTLLSPASLLSMARPPVEARLRAILSPQRRQRPSRSIVLLVSAGAAVGVMALASLHVQADQRSALARAQIEALTAETNMHTAASRNASIAFAHARPQALHVAGMSLVLGRQGNAQTPPATLRKSDRTDDAAVLRKRLDALEQLLVQNQQENARLRQQIRTLEARQNQRVKATGAQQNQRAKELEAQEYARAAMSKRTADAAAEQFAATRTILRDLQRQQELLKTQAQQADALYRNGMTTYQDAIRRKADVDINHARIDAAEAQLKGLKAGHPPTAKQQLVAQLREQLAEQKAELAQEQEGLRIAQERFRAGIANNSEVVDAELKVSRTQAEIDKLNAQILQATAR
ncbi:MAG: hypothetical protein JWL77_4193 [Chthonomonadaceae bacterium]|nr:hypothetical protein [Chthonomonadaceae bacterium]